MKCLLAVATVLIVGLAAGIQPVSAQPRLEGEEDPELGLLFGVSVWEELSLQLGLGYVFNQDCTESFCFQEGASMAMEYLPTSPGVVGVRGSIWTARLLSAGLGAGYYTDFEEGTFLLQPEIGIGFSGARIVFRINVPLDDRDEVARASEVEVTASGLIDIF